MDRLTGAVYKLRAPVVGSASASHSCSAISAAVRAASEMERRTRGGGRSSSSDDRSGAGSSCSEAPRGARAPSSRSASSIVSLQ